MKMEKSNKLVLLAAGAPVAIGIVKFIINMLKAEITMIEFIGLLQTLALCYYLYIGKLWARNLMLILCACAEIVAIIFLIYTFSKYKTVAYPIVLSFTFMVAYSLLLILPKSIKTHFKNDQLYHEKS